MIKILGMSALVVGVLFDLIGCLGLVRLPDLYNRLQAATKCVTMGTCMILIGTMLLVNSWPAVVQSALCLLFILITSPTAADALAKGAHAAGIQLWSHSVRDDLAEDQP
ncbi:MAG: monovalent cation/H(+) antiporter subunit G [candidate division FCPU426 bacterium]